MASGFETKPATRNTFAFTGPDPVQNRPSAQGNFRGAQVVGGESRSGMETSTAQAAPIGGQLGEYFERLLQPYVERRQKQQFIRGLTEQMSRQAGDEIRASKGGFAQIFGPTAFEQGAVFYSAKKAATDWTTEKLADMDNLKRLSPEDLSRAVADGIQALETGDPITDNAVQMAVLEASGPLIETVAKERYKWQQETASRSARDAWHSAAGLLQQLSSRNAQLSSPDDSLTATLAQSKQAFLSSLQQPYGMDSDTYRTSLFDFMRKSMQDGNFAAVEALRDAGIADIFDDEDRTKLDNYYRTYGDQAIAKAMSDPNTGLMDKLLRIDESLAKSEIDPNAYSVMDMVADLRAVNADARRISGVNMDLLDYKEIRAEGRRHLGSVVSAIKRQQDHQWQVEIANVAEDRREAREQRELAEATAAATAAWGVGRPRTSILEGIADAKMFDKLALRDYTAGNYTSIVRASKTEQWVSQPVADMMQAKVRNSIGDQYTESTKEAYQEWSKLNQLNGAAAQLYYGDFHVQMLNFDKLQRGGMRPEAAFKQAFNNPANYAVSVDPNRRKAVDKAITENVEAATSFSVFGMQAWGRTNLNPSSKIAVENGLRRGTSLLLQNSDLPEEAAVSQAASQMAANGTLERYGAHAWQNSSPTTSFGKLLGLQEREADTVVSDAIDRSLKAGGFAAGGGGENYVYQRFTDQNGNPALMVQALDDDAGHPITAYITLDQLRAAAQQRSVSQRGSPSSPAKPNRTMQKFRQQQEAEKKRFSRGDKPIDAGKAIADAALDAARATPVGSLASGLVAAARPASARISAMARTNAAKRAARKSKRK